MPDDRAEMKQALQGMTVELGQQLKSITEEMSKIKGELYGDQGIGGIAKQLEQLKGGGLDKITKDLGGLEGLLAKQGLGGLGAGAGAGAGGRRGAPSGREDALTDGAGASSSITELDRQRLEEKVRRRQQHKKNMEEWKKTKKAERNGSSTSMGERFVLFLFVLVLLYFGSNVFNTMVNQTIRHYLFGEDYEDMFDENAD